jgi:hypothetical protein
MVGIVEGRSLLGITITVSINLLVAKFHYNKLSNSITDERGTNLLKDC